jgi:hypothetical protein
MSMTRLLTVAALILSAPLFAVAQPPPGGRPHGPPPAAFEACKGKSAGDACEVTFSTPTGDEHTVKGTCAALPDARLACRPEPPPQALQACDGKHEGDACSFTMGEHTVDGQCHQGPRGNLACRPARP